MLASPGRPWLASMAIANALSLGAYLATLNRLFLDFLTPLLAILLLFLLFFRDPERVTGPGIVAAADGRLLHIQREGDRLRLATFMNLTDVHVNRVPWPGTLLQVEEREGRKLPAFVPDASRNAQKRYLFSTSLGPMEVIQITGLLARRCVSYISEGHTLQKGERLGMILFGSRVDLVLSANRVRVLVNVGDRLKAGVTTIAEAIP